MYLRLVSAVVPISKVYCFCLSTFIGELIIFWNTSKNYLRQYKAWFVLKTNSFFYCLIKTGLNPFSMLVKNFLEFKQNYLSLRRILYVVWIALRGRGLSTETHSGAYRWMQYTHWFVSEVYYYFFFQYRYVFLKWLKIFTSTVRILYP